MNTTSLFDPEQPLTKITKEKIETFLPGLWDDVFKIATPLPLATTTEVDRNYSRETSSNALLDCYAISSNQCNKYPINK